MHISKDSNIFFTFYKMWKELEYLCKTTFNAQVENMEMSRNEKICILLIELVKFGQEMHLGHTF